NYPYVGWEEKTTGGLPTLQTYDVEGNSGTVSVSTKMNVADNGSKLSVQLYDSNGNLTGNPVDVVDEYHYFPFVFDDGCVHFIKDVL
ncbi:MAG: hypothetical protein Q8914_09970, partial [Bacteroidota bacterium]|nr:hypothetical protein [Bacteroidota bacterium]